MFPIFRVILTFLSPIASFINKLIGPIVDKYFQTKQVQITAEADVSKTSIEGISAVEQKWGFVAAMIPIFAMPYALYTWKAIVWDKVVGSIFNFHDTTDPISGPLGWGYTIILPAIFMHIWISSK